MRRDVIDAVRQWRKTPGAALVALVSFAIGIGANLAIIAVLDALVFRHLPVEAPESLVTLLKESNSAGSQAAVTLSESAWDTFRTAQPVLPAVFSAAAARFNLAPGGEAKFVSGLYLSGNALDVLGVPAVRGRPLMPTDDVRGAAPVAMVSTALWQTAFGARTKAIGGTITLDGHPFTIVGVLPPEFWGLHVGRTADVVIPASAFAVIHGEASARASEWLSIFGRLGQGQGADTATVALDTWLPVLGEAGWPDGRRDSAAPLPKMTWAPASTGASPLRRAYVPALVALLGAVAALLLMASANLSALVLARHADRTREIGVRLALGAGRARIVRGLLVESVLLAVAGAAAGLWLAWALAGVLAAQLTSPALGGLPVTLHVEIDARLAAVAVLLGLASGTLAGLVPAWRAARTPAWMSMASAVHGRRSRPLEVLVTVQLAVSLVLAAGAAAGIRSFVGLVTAPTGLEPDQALVVSMNGELAGPTPGTRFATIEALRTAIRAVPGVTAASAGVFTPLSGGLATVPLEVPGTRSPRAADGPPATIFNPVLPGFFDAVGTPLVAGRGFDDGDGPGTPAVAIVNQAFEAEHFGTRAAVGRVIMLGGVEMHIVGVVADARVVSLREQKTVPAAFGLLTQLEATDPIRRLHFVVRSVDPEDVRRAIVGAVARIDPRLGIEVTTMREDATRSVERERLIAWLGGAFAVFGLALAVVGLYGTFTYLAARRRTEIGVRMAVGATSSDVLWLVAGGVARLTVLGTALGLGACWGAARVVQGLLIGVDALDPRQLGSAVAAVMLAAAVATIGPARRAVRTDPLVALREG